MHTLIYTNQQCSKNPETNLRCTIRWKEPYRISGIGFYRPRAHQQTYCIKTLNETGLLWTGKLQLSCLVAKAFHDARRYLFEELLERHFSLCDEQHVLHDHLVLDEVDVPEMTERQVGQQPRHTQLAHQPLPVALLHRLRLELHNDNVDSRVRLQHLLDMLVGRVGAQAHRQVIELAQQSIQRLTDLRWQNNNACLTHTTMRSFAIFPLLSSRLFTSNHQNYHQIVMISLQTTSPKHYMGSHLVNITYEQKVLKLPHINVITASRLTWITIIK